MANKKTSKSDTIKSKDNDTKKIKVKAINSVVKRTKKPSSSAVASGKVKSDVKHRYDFAKWSISLFIFISCIVGNFHFDNYPFAARATVILLVMIIALVLAFTTAKGKVALDFINGARYEAHKVTWPNRQEVWRTLLFVLLLICIATALIWLMDSVFSMFVRKLFF